MSASMVGASLAISLDRSHGARPSARPPDADYTAYPGLLRAAGFSTIVLEGLTRFGARGADGAPLDRIELSVEEDAEQLALACEALAHLEIGPRPQRHEIYLQGGEFEITAVLAEGQAIVRAGVFIDDFDPDDARNARMAPAEYFALWSAIGEELDGAAAGLRRPQDGVSAPRPSDSATAAAGGEDLSKALTAFLQIALRIVDDPRSSHEAGEALRQWVVSVLGEAGNGLDTLDDMLAALPRMLREQASRAGADAELRPAIDAASEIVALLERLDAMPASPHRDALADLLPEPSGRGPETDAERAERLHREAKEQILASMRKHGLDGS
jgi:hypothetical protein